MSQAVMMFGSAGHWTVYDGRITVGRFTVKRKAEQAMRETIAAKKASKKK